MVWVICFKSPDCTHGRCLRETHWLVVSPNNNSPSRYHALSSIPCFGRHWRHITQGNWTRHCPPLCSCERPGSPRGRKLHWKTGQTVSTSVIPRLRDFHRLRWKNLTIHKITSQMGFAKAKHMASLKPWMDFSWESSVAARGTCRNKKTTVEVGNHHDNLAKVINRPTLFLDSGCVTWCFTKRLNAAGSKNCSSSLL